MAKTAQAHALVVTVRSGGWVERFMEADVEAAACSERVLLSEQAEQRDLSIVIYGRMVWSLALALTSGTTLWGIMHTLYLVLSSLRLHPVCWPTSRRVEPSGGGTGVIVTR